MSWLVKGLLEGDLQQRQAAGAALVAAGERAIEPLLAALYEADACGSFAAERACLAVLHRLGDAALPPLVHAIASAVSWRQMIAAGEALKGLKVSHRGLFVDALHHASPAVRNRTLCVFENMGADALPYASAVLTLVGDPETHVRARAFQALKAMGPDVLPVLREIRNSRTINRRHALTAQAELGGWNALEPADQALIRRLITVKIRRELPEPILWCGTWYAIRTNDQSAVLEMFGLSDAMPVTMRLGAAAGGDRWAFVTPVLDGWTLVFGEPSGDAPLHDASDDQVTDADPCNGHVVALSRRFGAAHWYAIFEGETAWCLAEYGQVVRYYYNAQPDTAIGTPHPAELDHLVLHADELRDDNKLDMDLLDEVVASRTPTPRDPLYEQLPSNSPIPAEASPVPDRPGLGRLIAGSFCFATVVAAAASVDPSTLGPHVSVQGHGVLALTGLGRWEGPPPGALPI